MYNMPALFSFPVTIFLMILPTIYICLLKYAIDFLCVYSYR